jgi:hypothetical protein
MSGDIIYLNDRRPSKGADSFIQSLKNQTISDIKELANRVDEEIPPLPDLSKDSLSGWIRRLEQGLLNIDEGLELFQFLFDTQAIYEMEPSYRYVGEALMAMGMVYIDNISDSREAVKENCKERERRLEAGVMFYSLILY